MRRLSLALLTLALPLSAGMAQPVIEASAPEAVAVTIYRNPDRGEGGIDMRWLSGFALVSETRTVTLPAGDARIAFEGVADGMVAVSAIVTGLPGGVAQKDRDARLLSPAALVDGSLGDRVHLRRTNRTTGQVVEHDAVIRSSSGGALVLQTAQGIEALRCSGLPETVTFDRVPQGLSARPRLSVTTTSPAAASARITLTYLATGFDWGADYVAKVDPKAGTLSLFAWLTVANTNSVGFTGSSLQVVAGRLNRSSDFAALDGDDPAPELRLQCWPLETTGTDVPMQSPPPAPPMMASMAQEIVVTAQRRAGAVMAVQEELGDLKLYRVPVRVDVNANGQKQVALLEKSDVPFQLIHTADLWVDQAVEGSQPTYRILRLRNRLETGLGLPLPAGRIAVMEGRAQTVLLLAQGALRDHAVGETVELPAGDSATLRFTTRPPGPDGRGRIDLTNANAEPIRMEFSLRGGDDRRISGRGVARKDGKWLWTVTVPANGSVSLDYRISPSS
ncbi:hypothetical protein WG908_09705 [Sphingobium sp. AN641]|uniref:DUF4139 domain-containing protein n=1 Tax=Sphingobium sp. AN641 TaxID=3133443 RepID=UPI0030BFF8DF